MKIAYLIGQYPAINHYYLLLEVQYLRQLGHEIWTASVASADRPLDQQRPTEQRETASTYYLKQESKERGVGVALKALASGPVRFFRALGSAFRTARVNQKSPAYGLFYFAEALLLADWMRTNGLRHVHASFTASIAMLATELDPALTFSFGVYGYGELYDPVGNQLTAKIARALCVRSVSRHGVGQLMLASKPEHWTKLLHIDLGIDPASFPARPIPPAAAGLELMTVGRISPEKGHRLLLDAMELLRAKGLPVKLRIVGDGPDRAFLEAEAQRRGLGAVVVFEGRVPQQRLEELYAQTGAFVLGSLYEGTPIVLMEAMSMRIPCLAPQINGVPEVVAHGESGLLFHPGDAAAIARHVETLVADPALRERLAEAGRQTVLASYVLERNSRIWGESLERVLNGTLK